MLVTDQAVLRDYKGEFNEKFNEMEGREDVEAFFERLLRSPRHRRIFSRISGLFRNFSQV